MTRSLRRIATWLCLASFLFAQGMLAAYACSLSIAADPMSIEVAAAVAGDAPCAGHEAPPGAPADTGPLCQLHCEGQSGVPGNGNAVTLIPPLLLAPWPAAVSLDLAPVRLTQRARAPHAAMAAAPPIALQYCRFLI